MYIIETLLPDGPHWYGGIRVISAAATIIAGPEFTPYWEDRKQYDKRSDAEAVIEVALKDQPGAYIVTADEAMKSDSRWANNGQYYMRAKYLSPGMQFQIANKQGVYTVSRVTKKTIFSNSNAGEKASFSKTVKESPFVRIIGKRQNNEVHKNNASAG